MIEQTAKTIAQNIKDNHGIAIPWVLIIQIALMVIDQCFLSKETFLTAARSPTILQRIGFMHVAREHGIRQRRDQIALAEEVFRYTADAEEKLLVACYQETRALFDPSYNDQSA